MKAHRLALLIVALHLALGVAYSVIVPLWEAYDEWGHYPYIRYLATARALPPHGGPIAAENDTVLGQPPLYYLLGAAATTWIDTSDWREPLRNRYSSHPTAMGGYNRALHGYDEDFPWRGAVLAVHVARFVSVALSAITVWFTYLIGRTLFPRRSEIALGAMAICAFWPQFLFIGGVINNDNLITTCAAVLLWFLVRTIVQPGRWCDRLGLVVALGGALAAKAGGLMFLPLVLLGLLASWGWDLRTLRRRQVAAIALAIGGVLLAATAAFLLLHPRYNGVRLGYLLNPRYMRKIGWSDGLGAARLMWGTLWASFGWQSVGVADWAYQVIQPIWLAAAVGWVAFLARPVQDGRPVKLAVAALLAAPLIVAAGILTRSMTSSYYVTGRYLLSTIAAFSTLLAVGLATLGDLIPSRRLTGSRVVLGVVGAGMLAFAVYAPLAYIAPVYARPAKLPASALDLLAHPIRVDFDHAIELAGYELEPTTFRPGDTVKVTLYWRCLREMTANYSLAIKLLGRGDAEIASLNTYPGRGNYPTYLWRRGDVFSDAYWLPVAGDATAPTVARLKVAFFQAESNLPPLQRLKVAHDPTRLEHLPVYNLEGQALGFAAIVGRFKLAAVGVPTAEPEHIVDYRLGDRIRLMGYNLPERVRRGQPLSVMLDWLAAGPTAKPYTVFVHVIDGQGRTVAQADSQPLQGYYPTDLWSAQEAVADAHSLALPGELRPGKYAVWIGFYDLETGQRLAVLDGEGRPVPDNRILLAAVRIED